MENEFKLSSEELKGAKIRPVGDGNFAGFLADGRRVMTFGNDMLVEGNPQNDPKDFERSWSYTMMRSGGVSHEEALKTLDQLEYNPESGRMEGPTPAGWGKDQGMSAGQVAGTALGGAAAGLGVGAAADVLLNEGRMTNAALGKGADMMDSAYQGMKGAATGAVNGIRGAADRAAGAYGASMKKSSLGPITGKAPGKVGRIGRALRAAFKAL